MKALINLLTVFLIALPCSASGDEQARYNDLFLKQEDLNKRYKDIYIRLSDINKLESLKTWYRLLAQKSSDMTAYNFVNSIIAPKIMGKSYRQLFYYYGMTGQVEAAAQTLGFYFLSVHALLDNTVNDPQAQAWNARVISRISKRLPTYREARSEIRDMQDCFKENMPRVKREYKVQHHYKVRGAYLKCVNRNRLAENLVRQLKYLFMQKEYYGAPFPVSFAGFATGNKVILHNRLPETREAILDLGNQLQRLVTTAPGGSDKLYKNLTIEDYKTLMEKPEDALYKLFPEQKWVILKDELGESTGEKVQFGFRNTIMQDNLSNFTGSVLGPVSVENLGIYGSMLQAIRDAEESVFVDLFWMGGTVGMNLAKELMKKVIENPQFTVVIITDNENKFNYGTQLDMIYKYMRAFSEKFTQYNFYITPTQINLKRTALPEFADLLVTNSTVNSLSNNDSIKELLAKDNFQLLAKSDHTKAMVMDGKNPHKAKAFVGSKNWTDSSGGVNQDQMAEVQGPGAALILDAFYFDALEAFKMDVNSCKRIQKKPGDSSSIECISDQFMVRNHVEAKFPGENPRKAFSKLLSAIDVQNRSTTGFQQIEYVPKGEAVIAPAQNNIYGSEMSTLEQNIQLILGAKEQILIDDQFLYDPQVVEAIKFAKKNHGVEVYVLVESLLGYETDEQGRLVFDGEGNMIYKPEKGIQIPNNLFVPELANLGIETKAYVRPRKVIAAMSEDQRNHNQGHEILGATFHVKSLSVDGITPENYQSSCQTGEFEVLNPIGAATVSGSANKDIMTMSGGFRESQVATYDVGAVGTHDCMFWSRWENRSIPSKGLEFDLPVQAGQMGIGDHGQFLGVLRSILFTPYNFTKDHM